MFAFKKNIIGTRKVPYVELFATILTYWPSSNDLEICCNWMLVIDDNILQALLKHMQDNLTLKYLGFYSKFRNEKLFLFSLQQNNTVFIRESLLIGAFDKQIFKEKSVVEQMLDFMKIGSKTNFLLNTLLLTDTAEWKNKYL